MKTFSRYADVRAALTDPALVPVPAADGGPAGSMAWLRALVARFSAGADHERRRAMVVADLARWNPPAVPVEGADDRVRAVATVAAGLGIPDPAGVGAAVAVAARTYFGGADDEADTAVAWLVAHLSAADPDAEPERIANRIGLLIQGCDATAALVASARTAGGEPDAAVSRALRDDPPVRVMRRVAARATRIGGVDIAPGEAVELDVAAAARESGEVLTFGVPPRACPGRDIAVAVAAGLVGGGAG